MSARNLYVTAMAPESGKSVVALGLMELLSRRVERLGFFRPIVPEEPDPQLELIRARYDATTAHALTADAASSISRTTRLRKRVVEAYKPLGRAATSSCAREPTSPAPRRRSTSASTPTSRTSWGAGARGRPRRPRADRGDRPRGPRGSLETKGCTLFGVVVNRVPVEEIDGVRAALDPSDEPVYLLPETVELAYPTMADVADALFAEVARRIAWP